MCILLSIIITAIAIGTSSSQLSKYTFPEKFKFGVASSAYQIEGAWNEDGKGENNWDYYLHHVNRSVVSGNANGDVSCDSYHKYKEDIKLLKQLGVHFYRFSISWTRILPAGTKGSKINPKGVAHYNKVINELLEANIEPVVTVYHWDLPQSLEANGGWLNRSIINHYTYYARLLFQLYGDRVKIWITFNEYRHFCESGYSDGLIVPFKKLKGVGGYLCTHHALIAHAKTFRIYTDEFKPFQRGAIGCTVDMEWKEPKTSSDTSASARSLVFNNAYYIDPQVYGDYPPAMRQRIDELSAVQGFNRSRLPYFTDEEKILLRGSFDFIGINHYTSRLSAWPTKRIKGPSAQEDTGVNETFSDTWKTNGNGTMAFVPWGMRKLMVWLKETYNNPPVYIFENGWITKDMNDTERIDYLEQYLSSLLDAIVEDECNIHGYSLWSFTDSLEWIFGYDFRYGLVNIDFNSPNRTRTLRRSFHVYKDIIKKKRISL